MNQKNVFTPILWGLLLVAPLPLLVLYFVQLWKFPQYQYFPVLFIAVVGIFYLRWDRVHRVPSLKNWPIWLSIGFGISLAFMAANFVSPWLACLGWVVCLGAFFATYREGTAEGASLITIWPATWLLLRLPLNLDLQFVAWLQSRTARVSSYLLDLSDVPHRLTGNVFSLSHGQLFVEEACSGVQSVFSLLFCAVLLVIWMRRSLPLLPIYAGIAVFWAGMMNIGRVYAVSVAQEWYQVDLSKGWQHEVLGYVCLAVAILLLLSADRLLRVVFYPVPEQDEPINPVEPLWNRLFPDRSDVDSHEFISGKASTLDSPRWLPIVTVVAGMLVVGSFVSQSRYAFGALREIRQAPVIEKWEANERLLERVQGLKVIDYRESTGGSDPSLGVHAHVWTCEKEGISFVVAVSQHAEFHDLCSCYKGNGWLIDRRKLATPSTASEDSWSYVEGKFHNTENNFGCLYYSALDRRGEPLLAKGNQVGSLFAQRVGGRDNPSVEAYDGESINVQVWMVSDLPASEDVLRRLQDLHLEIREVVRRSLAEGDSYAK